MRTNRADNALKGQRKVYFEEHDDFVPTAIYDYAGLRPGTEIRGPAIVETPITTIVINPKDSAAIDEFLNVRISLGDPIDMALIRNVDPITFEVLSHRLHQITREMGITLERTGGTVTTTQQHDYNASLYRPDGDIMAAGETYGQHVVCAGFAVKRIRERFSADEIYADDIFLLNDPYLAAIHNSDVYVIAPIHFKNELVGWSATFVHVSDVGAMTPGGDSPDATEVFQEGIRFPGIKLVERGRLEARCFRRVYSYDAAAGRGRARSQMRNCRQQRGQGQSASDV